MSPCPPCRGTWTRAWPVCSGRIDAYTLVLASLLMLAGSTADRIGRSRVFMTGLVALHARLGALLARARASSGSSSFRMIQAVGGSMLNPVAMSIITNTFTDPRERARAIGVWGGVVGISMAAGPDRRRPARGHRRLALDLLAQPAGGPRRAPADPAVRARVPRAEGPPPGPGRPVPGHRAARLADVRDHRGARFAGSPTTLAFGGGRPRRAARRCSTTSPGAPNPSSTCGSSARRRSAGRP